MRIKEMLSKLNLIKRYKMYRGKLDELSEINTTDVAEFMKMDNNQRDIVLFSLVTANKIKQDLQMKLLYVILTIVTASGSGTAYYALGA